MNEKKLIIAGLLGAAFLLGAADIRCEKGADNAVQFAAKDLARCLSAVSGEKYAVQTGGQAVKGDIVLRTDPQLKSQEWKLQTENGILTISGCDSPGIVYGVYTFLKPNRNPNSLSNCSLSLLRCAMISVFRFSLRLR